jgi:hypothetical protein
MNDLSYRKADQNQHVPERHQFARFNPSLGGFIDMHNKA